MQPSFASISDWYYTGKPRFAQGKFARNAQPPAPAHALQNTLLSCPAAGASQSPLDDEETIGGALSAYVYCEKSDGEFYISFRLIEDGTIVENAGDETRYYDVAMLDNYGELYEFEGTMSAGNRDVYFFADGESTELIRALNRDGSLRFALTDASNPMVRYDFALEDTTGFADLVKAMGY